MDAVNTLKAVGNYVNLSNHKKMSYTVDRGYIPVKSIRFLHNKNCHFLAKGSSSLISLIEDNPLLITRILQCRSSHCWLFLCLAFTEK